MSTNENRKPVLCLKTFLSPAQLSKRLAYLKLNGVFSNKSSYSDNVNHVRPRTFKGLSTLQSGHHRFIINSLLPFFSTISNTWRWNCFPHIFKKYGYPLIKLFPSGSTINYLSKNVNECATFNRTTTEPKPIQRVKYDSPFALLLDT